MKKRIAIALCMLLAMLMLGACGTDPTTVDYNGETYEGLQTQMSDNISMVQQLSLMFSEYGLTADTISDTDVEYLSENFGVTQSQLDATEKWMQIEDEYGDLQGEAEEDLRVTKSADTLTVGQALEFEKGNAVFELVFDYDSMEITGISVEPDYSLSERLQQSGLGTLILTMIVCIVLIVISLIIYSSLVLPHLGAKKNGTAAAAASSAAYASAAASGACAAPGTDTELAAVIAAAIAAATGSSTSDFVVRSINRR